MVALILQGLRLDLLRLGFRGLEFALLVFEGLSFQQPVLDVDYDDQGNVDQKQTDTDGHCDLAERGDDQDEDCGEDVDADVSVDAGGGHNYVLARLENDQGNHKRTTGKNMNLGNMGKVREEASAIEGSDVVADSVAGA